MADSPAGASGVPAAKAAEEDLDDAFESATILGR